MPKKIQLLAAALIAALCLSAALALAVHDMRRRLDAGDTAILELRALNATLEKELGVLRAASAVKPPAHDSPRAAEPDSAPSPDAAAAHPPPASPAPAASFAPETDTEYRIGARLSALEKFVPLSPEQREQLRERFRERLPAGSGASESDALIEEVIGKENAQYYREQKERAFQRAEEEEREKEILLISRRLALLPEQEAKLKETIEQTDRELRQARKAAVAGEAKTMAERVQMMIEENRMRQELLDARLKEIFSAEQYQRYIEQGMDSTERNLEVFHGPP